MLSKLFSSYFSHDVKHINTYISKKPSGLSPGLSLFNNLVCDALQFCDCCKNRIIKVIRIHILKRLLMVKLDR